MQLSKEERDLSWSTRQGALGCLRELSEISQGVRYLKLTRTIEGTMMFNMSNKIPYVEIVWLKGYCILSTIKENIHGQSCSSNRGIPCILHTEQAQT